MTEWNAQELIARYTARGMGTPTYASIYENGEQVVEVINALRANLERRLVEKNGSLYGPGMTVRLPWRLNGPLRNLMNRRVDIVGTLRAQYTNQLTPHERLLRQLRELFNARVFFWVEDYIQVESGIGDGLFETDYATQALSKAAQLQETYCPDPAPRTTIPVGVVIEGLEEYVDTGNSGSLDVPDLAGLPAQFEKGFDSYGTPVLLMVDQYGSDDERD